VPQARRLVKGPEYAVSIADCRAEGLPRFEEHVSALLWIARFMPEAARPFLGPDDRVQETFDPAHGYRAMLFFSVHRERFESELKWIEVGPHHPDVYPWTA
jgi:hypothetical protein